MQPLSFWQYELITTGCLSIRVFPYDLPEPECLFAAHLLHSDHSELWLQSSKPPQALRNSVFPTQRPSFTQSAQTLESISHPVSRPVVDNDTFKRKFSDWFRRSLIPTLSHIKYQPNPYSPRLKRAKKSKMGLLSILRKVCMGSNTKNKHKLTRKIIYLQHYRKRSCSSFSVLFHFNIS